MAQKTDDATLRMVAEVVVCMAEYMGSGFDQHKTGLDFPGSDETRRRVPAPARGGAPPAQGARRDDAARHTLRAIAVAYRRVRRLGERDLLARQAAEAVYQERHPASAGPEAQHMVALMISAVASDHPAWFWNGISAVRN